ncbi:MAG: hypothetical protein ACD_62C00528G0002 [uncultured bacterium]|nr:MAG: hypothetical protein ACD_62C00528G0002 [uncultured bacterium]
MSLFSVPAATLTLTHLTPAETSRIPQLYNGRLWPAMDIGYDVVADLVVAQNCGHDAEDVDLFVGRPDSLLADHRLERSSLWQIKGACKNLCASDSSIRGNENVTHVVDPTKDNPFKHPFFLSAVGMHFVDIDNENGNHVGDWPRLSDTAYAEHYSGLKAMYQGIENYQWEYFETLPKYAAVRKASFERDYLAFLLERTKGNLKKMGKILGVDAVTLVTILQRNLLLYFRNGKSFLWCGYENTTARKALACLSPLTSEWHRQTVRGFLSPNRPSNIENFRAIK